MERRYLNREVRAETTGDKRKINGVAAVFYDGTPNTEYVLWDDQWGRAVERIMPGAFDSAMKRPDDVRGLFNHDVNLILGRTSSGTMQLSTHSDGLHYEIEPGDTSISRDVLQHLDRKDVTGSSFAFLIPAGGQRWEMTESPDGKLNEVREITDVELFDVGPVTFPAYEATSAGARSETGIAELRSTRSKARDATPKNTDSASPNSSLCRMRLELAEKS